VWLPLAGDQTQSTEGKGCDIHTVENLSERLMVGSTQRVKKPASEHQRPTSYSCSLWNDEKKEKLDCGKECNTFHSVHSNEGMVWRTKKYASPEMSIEIQV